MTEDNNKLFKRVGEAMGLMADALAIVASVIIIKFLLETLEIIKILRTP